MMINKQLVHLLYFNQINEGTYQAIIFNVKVFYFSHHEIQSYIR